MDGKESRGTGSMKYIVIDDAERAWSGIVNGDILEVKHKSVYINDKDSSFISSGVRRDGTVKSLSRLIVEPYDNSPSALFFANAKRFADSKL